jgi:hypothetical protein
MIKTGKKPHEKIQNQEKSEVWSQGNRKNSEGDPEQAKQKNMPVFKPVSLVDDEKLGQKGNEKSEVRKEADVGVLGNKKFLGVEQRKDHRYGDRSRIIECMKKGGCKQDLSFHHE